MNLSSKPDTINFPETHYVYVELTGNFMETAPKVWETLHKNTKDISEVATITGYFSLYKVQPEMVYRAGVAVDSKPSQLPDGVKYVKFEGGQYARFTLKGSYSQLPDASGKVFEYVESTDMPVRDGWFIENYVNSPETTPEEQLITEIMIPTV